MSYHIDDSQEKYRLLAMRCVHIQGTPQGKMQERIEKLHSEL